MAAHPPPPSRWLPLQQEAGCDTDVFYLQEKSLGIEEVMDPWFKGRLLPHENMTAEAQPEVGRRRRGRRRLLWVPACRLQAARPTRLVFP